jgi:hypothetical protein
VPDRLASRIVETVIEELCAYRCLNPVYSDIGITNLNNATDAAIEEVEKLLRED